MAVIYICAKVPLLAVVLGYQLKNELISEVEVKAKAKVKMDVRFICEKSISTSILDFGMVRHN